MTRLAPADAFFRATAGAIAAVEVGVVELDAVALTAVDAIFATGEAVVGAVDVDADVDVDAISVIFTAGEAAIGAAAMDAGASIERRVASVGRRVPRLSTR